ncbi:MAG: hypothetical protein HGA54_03010 [Actinobacteria bacterium]|nr:hypothetical protein [Actinomycetota bacterium]
MSDTERFRPRPDRDRYVSPKEYVRMDDFDLAPPEPSRRKYSQRSSFYTRNERYAQNDRYIRDERYSRDERNPRRERYVPQPKRNVWPLLIAGAIILIILIAFTVIQIRGAAVTSAAIELDSLTANDSAAANVPVVKELTPTPLIAEYEDVLIHCPINTDELTELCFHQASFEWGLVLQTELPEIDAETCINNHGSNRPSEQPTGNVYLNGSALHVWRSDAYTEIDTAIDCGGSIGATVYAPVSGTVVLVKRYMLYGECEDYEIHIQPTDHPELDVVILHTTDIQVVAGDEVIGGVTVMSKVRNLSDFIDGIQLENFTADGDMGNHAHVQVNYAYYEDYTGLDGAITVE